jgi:hypothetical protein
MGLEITKIADGRIAVATSTGPITPPEREAHRDAVVKFCRENGIHHVIVDTREQICCSETMEVFGFASSSVEAIRGLHVALIPSTRDRDIVFIDAVAGNRGASTRICRSIDEARTWLESSDKALNEGEPRSV